MAAIKWKLKAGMTWRLRLEQEHPNHGRIFPVPPRLQKRLGTGTMLISSPLDVDAIIRQIRKGKLITQSAIRARLAKKSNADSTCSMTTGMFLRMVAEAAEEDLRGGRKRVTPYWRTIKDDGKLNEKFPGGVKAQTARLRGEGFTIQPGKGKQPPRVKDFEKYLVHRHA